MPDAQLTGAIPRHSQHLRGLRRALLVVNPQAFADPFAELVVQRIQRGETMATLAM
jgi:hypothetical protein